MRPLNHAELAENNQRQLEEALSDDNRYFFHLHHGRDGSDSELMIYYIENGGACGHRQRMEERATQGTSPTHGT